MSDNLDHEKDIDMFLRTAIRFMRNTLTEDGHSEEILAFAESIRKVEYRLESLILFRVIREELKSLSIFKTIRKVTEELESYIKFHAEHPSTKAHDILFIENLSNMMRSWDADIDRLWR